MISRPRKKTGRSSGEMRWTILVFATALLLGLFALPSKLFGESNSVSAGSSAPEYNVNGGGTFTGGFDLRPSWGIANNDLHTENYFEAGYALSYTSSLSLGWDINTNINDPTGYQQGFNATLIDMFPRVRAGTLLTLPGDLELSYEARIYLPVEKITRDRGMVTVLRNYFNFTKKFSPEFKLIFTELPILHVYDTEGYGVGPGKKPNPIFENRLHLKAEIKLTKNLNLNIPLMFHMLKYKEFKGSLTSGDVEYYLWLHPELLYAYNDYVSFGVAFYTLNLLDPHFSHTTFGDGFRNGVAQISFSAWM